MYLSNGIRTIDGRRYPMAGIVPGEAQMRDRLQALGYVEVETRDATLLGPLGLRFRGHQFRYSDLQLDTDVEQAYTVRRRRGGAVFEEGYRVGNTLASYVHAPLGIEPAPRHGARRCLRRTCEADAVTATPASDFTPCPARRS